MNTRSTGEDPPAEFEDSGRPDGTNTGTLERRSSEDHAVVRTVGSTPNVGRREP